MSAVQATVAILGGGGDDQVIHVDVLNVDHEYQRPPNPTRAKAMSGKAFDQDLVGRLIVSRRSDGSYWVVDGQHRLIAMKLTGITHVPCVVYSGWTRQQEAHNFVKLNQGIKPSAYDLHHSRVCEGEPIAVDIEAIVAEIGGKIGPRNNPDTGLIHHISCVDTLRRIYGLRNEHGLYPVERYGGKTNGREHLRRTLRIIMAAWGAAALDRTEVVRPFHADVVKGLATFLWFAPDDPNYSEERLIEALRKVAPGRLTQKASGKPGVGVPRGIAEAIREQYNAATRVKKLSLDWVIGDLPK